MKPKSLRVPSVLRHLAVFLTCTSAHAVDYTWDGGANALWTNATNWSADTAPVPANVAKVIFSGTTVTTTNNDFPVDSIFSGFSFPNTTTGESFTLSGNTITLAGAETRTTAAVATGSITDTIDLGFKLNTNLQWSLGNNHGITMNGLISEVTGTPRSVTALTGTATLALTNAGNSFTGELASQNSAIISVTSIANGGVASAAGAGTAIRLGASTTAQGRFVYAGTTAASTDRTVNLAATNTATATLFSSGSEPIIFTGPFTNASLATFTKTLALGGTNTGANEITSILGNGAGGGSLAVSLIDTAAWKISGNNTYNGGTALGNTARLNIAHANALGTGAFNLGNGTFDNVTGSDLTIPNAANVTGNPTFAGSSQLTIGGDTALAGTGTRRTLVVSTGTLTLGGVVSGAKGLGKSGLGTLVLTNANNSFTGELYTQNATVSIASIKNSTVNSAAGAGSSLEFGPGGILTYTGTGDSTDRAILQSGINTGGFLNNNGSSGALVMNGTFTNTKTNDPTFTLGGSNTANNTFNSVISNGATAALSLAKAGTGLWMLTQSNTYSGTTTVNGGTLQVGNGGTAGKLPTGSAIVINTGGKLSFNRSDTVVQGTDFTSAQITGAGTLEIKGGGTLQLNNADSFTSGIAITVASGSTLNLNYDGSETIAALTLGGTPASAGPHNAGTDPTFITGTGTLIVQPPVTTVPNIISIVRNLSGDVILTLDAPATGLTVQQSNDLSNGSFTDIASTIVGNVITISAAVTDPNADGKDFYRVSN